MLEKGNIKMEKQMKKGQKVEYKKELMFGKGTVIETAKIVAIRGDFALLDNGVEIYINK